VLLAQQEPTVPQDHREPLVQQDHRAQLVQTVPVPVDQVLKCLHPVVRLQFLRGLLQSQSQYLVVVAAALVVLAAGTVVMRAVARQLSLD